MESISISSETQNLNKIRVGKNVEIFSFVNAYGCSIGDNTRVGAFVEIQKNATIGKYCKISSHSFICEGVHIADYVFIGHNVTFINDRFPRSANENGVLRTEKEWECMETYVEKGASIGSSATIMCGITIGKNAIVGAGSMVLRDVPENAVVAGNPARILKYLP